MVDLAFGPASDPRPPGHDHAYLSLLRRRRAYGAVLIVLFVGLMAGGFQVAQDRNAGGFVEGLSRLGDFPSEVLSEAWAKRAQIPGVMIDHFGSLIETINIAAVSTLCGALVAAGLALLSTRGLAPFPRLTALFRRVMDLCRALPEVVVALVLIFLLGGGPVPAVLAIALHTVGALGKLFSEAAENADLKPVEGLASTGAGWGSRMVLAVLPQVAPNWLSYALLRFEVNVRASAILGFVGAGGIGYDLKIALQWGQGRYDLVVGIFLLLFLTIVAIDRLSDGARRRLVKGAMQ